MSKSGEIEEVNIWQHVEYGVRWERMGMLKPIKVSYGNTVKLTWENIGWYKQNGSFVFENMQTEQLYNDRNYFYWKCSEDMKVYRYPLDIYEMNPLVLQLMWDRKKEWMTITQIMKIVAL